MPLDPYSYVAPSRVKAFLCPMGKLKRSTFLNYADRLNNVREIRLVDVTPDGRSDRALFSPQGFPNGKVVYDFSIAPIDNDLSFLHDLEPWRRCFCVFALTTFSYRTSMEDYEGKVLELRKKYPNALVHKILVFGVPAVDALQDSKNVIPILSSRLSTVTSMGTVMCDITTDFLAELAVLAITREMGSFKSPGLMELEHPVSAFQGDRPYNGTFQPNGNSRTHSPTNSFSSSTSKLTSGLASKTGSLSLGLTDRAKAKQNGRSKKYLAGLYLISGRWQDALKTFSEAATSLKSAHDYLWFASALEGIGICLLLLSFLEAPVSIPPVALQITHHGSFSHSHSFSDSNESLTPTSSGPAPLPPSMFEFLPELTNTMLKFYGKSQSTPEESVPQIVYCETILRFTNLLAVTRLNGGWNPASLSSVVRGTYLGKNITPDSPSITAITSWLNRAYSTDLKNLPIVAQCNIYSGIASIYSNIGLLRKRSFIIRELLLTVTPRLARARNVNAAIQGTHADGNISLDKHVTHLIDGEREGGIIELLDSISKVYGAGDITSIGYGWIQLRVYFLKTCLALCETIPDFNGVVHFAGLLLSTCADILDEKEQMHIFNAIIKAVDAARRLGQGNVLSDFWDPNLIRDIKFVSTNSSILPQSRSTPNPVSNDESVFLHNPFASKRGTEANTNQDRILVQNERADFVVKLQNPFAFDLQIHEINLITKNVEVTAKATNIYISPYSTQDINIPVIPTGTGNLQIAGANVQVVGCNKSDFFLTEKAPFSEEFFGVGEEKIKKIGSSSGVGHSRSEFINLMKYRTVDIDVIAAQPVMVLKNISINQGWMMLSEGERQIITVTLANISDLDANYVSLKFFDSTTQPLQVALNNKDLAQNEVYEIEYFLYNRKALQWIEGDEQKVSQNGHHSVVGPVVKQTEPVSVAAHKAMVFHILVLGKRGLTDGSIQVEYANQKQPPNEEPPSNSPFWHRTLSVPLNITVNSSIELGGCDMMGLQGNHVFTDDPNIATSHLSKYLSFLKAEKKHLSEYCLLVVDLRNSLNQSVEVNLWSTPKKSYTSDNFEVLSKEEAETDSNDKDRFTVTEIIHSGKTKRILVPIKRIQFSEEELARPVPSLSNRQFVVSANISQEKARTTREHFWYRQALLSMLGGSWKVVEHEGIPRSGILELRGIRLTKKMINVLRVEGVSISMRVETDDTADCGKLLESKADEILPTIDTEYDDDEKMQSSDYSVKAEEDYISLYTRICNKTARHISGYLRIIPSQRYGDMHSSANTGNVNSNVVDRWANMDSKVLFNGSLQQSVIDIPPGGEARVSLGMLFLYRGEYEFTALFDEFPVWGDDGKKNEVVNEAASRQHGQRDPICIKAL